jgi:guanylate kinase
MSDAMLETDTTVEPVARGSNPMRPATETGKLVIISGPSAVGKSTVVRELLQQCDLPLRLSVSATTRQPRPGEVEGVNYYYLTYDEFQRRRHAGEFLECFEPYGNGTWYGTLRETVATGLKQGKWVLLEIEVNGAMEVMDLFPDVISIFVRPESFAVLEQRIRGRLTESEEEILARLRRAEYELSLSGHYGHQVINDTVDQAVRDICNILHQYNDPQ